MQSILFIIFLISWLLLISLMLILLVIGHVFMYISDLTYVATIYDLTDYVAVDNVDNVH